MCETICKAYIDIINKHSPQMVNTVMKKHRYEYTFNAMIDLSRCYDIVMDRDDTKNTESFMLALKEKYGCTEEYWKEQDELWKKLN